MENEYYVAIKLRNENYAVYHMTDKAKSEEEAGEKAKLFLAENEYWPTTMSIEDRMNQMEIVTIKKLEEGETLDEV